MNVFDFDKTIYNGDSTADFFFWCMKRHPRVMLYIPKIGYYAALYYLFHVGDKTHFKEKMYSFLKAIDPERDIDDFWKEKLNNIKVFYKKLHRDDDVIISASPEFLLKPLEEKLNITVIASRVDVKSGKYSGKNCFNAEKMKRFRESFPDTDIKEFYSDSYADEPLALIAEKAFIVEKNTIKAWDFTRHKKNLRI